MADESTSRRVEVHESGGRIPGDDDWETQRGSVFDATVVETTTRTWTNDGESTETQSTVERDLRVRVVVEARTAPIAGVPNADLDGPLSNAADRATVRVVEDAGGVRGAARSAALDGSTSRTATARAAPTVDRDRLVQDLGERREWTRNVSVTVPGPALGAGRVNPPALLREELESREDELLGESGTGPSERAVRASRIAYLDAVDDRLASASNGYDEVNAGLQRRMNAHLDEERLDGALAAHRMANRGRGNAPSDPAGDLALSVETKPGYLPTKAVRQDRMDVDGGCTVHPLSTRNVNVFASPHGQVAGSVVESSPVPGSRGVSLATAGETLASDGELSVDDRQALEREAARATAHVRCELVAELVEAGIDEEDARSALVRDVSTATEALLLANGTTVERAAASLGGEHVSENRLRDGLDRTLQDALRDEAARPAPPPANEVDQFARNQARDELEQSIASGFGEVTGRGKERLLGERMGSLPAGLPIVPVPGFWYATANVWFVETTGTHERFVVRADRGDPTGQTTYIRDDRTVELEHGDRQVRLGTAERVSFSTETAVVVVVPPGGSGVGDTNGVVDERSPGWGD